MDSLESPDSSSPGVTRAVAAGLRGQYNESFVISPWQRPLLKLLGYLPQGVARWTMSRFNEFSGIDPARIQDLSVNELIQQRLVDYQGIQGRYPVVVTGAALGGASAHLSLALKAPFLPPAFVLTLRKGTQKGDIQEYLQLSKQLAVQLARNNPQTILIQHFDPIHDEWVVRYANHIRLKLIDLPLEYKDFIHRYLEPGGTICFLDCKASWPRYIIDERNYFQVGGWGDIPPDEYFWGSQRIDRFSQEVGFTHSRWQLTDHTIEPGPESEWGSEPGLANALQDFCNKEGYRFVRISLPGPFDFSRLAYHVIARQLRNEDRQPGGVLIESFGQFDATSVLHAGLLPVWLVFNTADNLQYLISMRKEFPPGIPVFFSPLLTFTAAPDRVSWIDWENALEGLDWVNIGTRPSHYPADPWVILDWERRLRRWVEKNSAPQLQPISVEVLQQIAQSLVL